MKTQFEYVRAESQEQAAELLEAGDARPMGGGTDLLTQLDRGIRTVATVVDLRGLGLDGIAVEDGRLRIGATESVAALTRNDDVRAGYAALAEAASAAASPQLREMGTVAGNLCQQPRCWYFRHPDLECWLRGGETCYAQIGDHRKHGLQPGDCISVAPSDLAAALLALDARVHTSRRADLPVAELYRRPSESDRTTLTLSAGEIVTGVEVPRAPDASSYQRAGERQAWSFALAGVAAARFGDDVRLAAIGVANIPILLDPADPLADLPGMEMTGWKRRLLAALAADALAAV